jgi:replicative DNA helicase
MFLHRPEMYRNEKGDAADNSEKGLAEVIIQKHRAGPTGTVKLVFMGDITRFENASRRDDVDYEGR